MDKKQVVTLITQAITRNNKFILVSGKSENPQVIAMVQHAKGQVDALESVRLALTINDLSELRIIAG